MGSIGLETTELCLFLFGHQEFLESLAFGWIGQLAEIFTLVPWAQFLGNQPNSSFVDHIDTKSFGGNHHLAYRGNAG